MKSLLHENWNRFYDPVVGQFTSVEPKLGVFAHLDPRRGRRAADSPDLETGPEFVLEQAGQGFSAAAYVYAKNNPLRFSDRDGLQASTDPECMAECDARAKKDRKKCEKKKSGPECLLEYQEAIEGELGCESLCWYGPAQPRPKKDAGACR